MLRVNPQTAPASQGDTLALDTLFKRLAERGKKIRTARLAPANKTADSDNLGRETLSAGQDPKPQGKESTDEGL